MPTPSCYRRLVVYIDETATQLAETLVTIRSTIDNIKVIEWPTRLIRGSLLSWHTLGASAPAQPSGTQQDAQFAKLSRHYFGRGDFTEHVSSDSEHHSHQHHGRYSALICFLPPDRTASNAAETRKSSRSFWLNFDRRLRAQGMHAARYPLRYSLPERLAVSFQPFFV